MINEWCKTHFNVKPFYANALSYEILSLTKMGIDEKKKLLLKYFFFENWQKPQNFKQFDQKSMLFKAKLF